MRQPDLVPAAAEISLGAALLIPSCWQAGRRRADGLLGGLLGLYLETEGRR